MHTINCFSDFYFEVNVSDKSTNNWLKNNNNAKKQIEIYGKYENNLVCFCFFALRDAEEIVTLYSI